MNGIFFYGKNNQWSIRFDHVTRTYVGKTPIASNGAITTTLNVFTSDGGESQMRGDEIQRFMSEYKAYLQNINQQGFLQEMVKK